MSSNNDGDLKSLLTPTSRRHLLQLLEHSTESLAYDLTLCFTPPTNHSLPCEQQETFNAAYASMNAWRIATLSRVGELVCDDATGRYVCPGLPKKVAAPVGVSKKLKTKKAPVGENKGGLGIAKKEETLLDFFNEFDGPAEKSSERKVEEPEQEELEPGLAYLQHHYPPLPTPLQELPKKTKESITLSLLLMFLSLERYDSRSRVLLLYVASSLDISPSVLNEQEATTAGTLLTAAEAAKNTPAKPSPAPKPAMAGWKLGLATVAGAAVIGLTGGLAAPFIAAGLSGVLGAVGLGGLVTATYLGAVATSPLVVAGLFGYYGASKSREMMNRYAAEVRDFRLLPVRKEMPDLLRATVGVGGWVTEPELPEFKDYAFSSPVEKEQRERAILTDIHRQLREPFSSLPGAVHVLRHDLAPLLELGSVLSTILKSAASAAITQTLVATTLLSPLAPALLPLSIIHFGKLLANPYSVCRHRSQRAGEILAASLIDGAVGRRPVTLIGFSLGSRVVTSCLKELARRGEYGIVEDVILMGAPVERDRGLWRGMRAVVAGRVVNIVGEGDWVLGLLERGTRGGVAGLGLGGWRVRGVEEWRMGGEEVEGHLGWWGVVGDIIEEFNTGKGKERPSRREYPVVYPNPKLEKREAARQVHDGPRKQEPLPLPTAEMLKNKQQSLINLMDDEADLDWGEKTSAGFPDSLGAVLEPSNVAPSPAYQPSGMPPAYTEAPMSLAEQIQAISFAEPSNPEPISFEVLDSTPLYRQPSSFVSSSATPSSNTNTISFTSPGLGREPSFPISTIGGASGGVMIVDNTMPLIDDGFNDGNKGVELPEGFADADRAFEEVVAQAEREMVEKRRKKEKELEERRRIREEERKARTVRAGRKTSSNDGWN